MVRKTAFVGLIASFGVLVKLVQFTLYIWALANVAGAMIAALAGHTDIDGFTTAEFLENFVGSPMFYAFVANGLVMFCSAVTLMVTKKK